MSENKDFTGDNQGIDSSEDNFTGDNQSIDLTKEDFTGDKKEGTSLLLRYEDAFRTFAIPRIPAWLHSYHLTFATVPLGLVAIVAGYLTTFNIHWLHLMTVAIVLQHITDLLDGALGRYREYGLAKWGYYMDHFLDYFFLCCLMISYSFLVPDNRSYILLYTLGIFSGYMINSFLDFGATGKMRIFHMKFGPSELKMAFIIINLMITLLGKVYFVKALPYIFLGTFLGLVVIVYQTQRRIWYLDLNKVQRIWRPGRRFFTVTVVVTSILILLMAFYFMVIE